MEWNGLYGLLYGLIGGLAEFLPVSPDAHKALLLKLTGLDTPGYGMSFAVHLGALIAVVLSSYKHLAKLLQERKILTQPKRKRQRQPDFASIMEGRLLRTAAIPLVLSCIAIPWLHQYFSKLWILVLVVVINGIVVLLPHYMSRANKDARTLSPLDVTLMGLGGVLGVIPGMSRVGIVSAVASMRGADRQFALDFTYLLSIPVLAALCIVDIFMIASAGNPQTGALILPSLLACVAAFGAAMVGMKLMRFLAVNIGYESLAYYNWGMAMFTFVIYLIG